MIQQAHWIYVVRRLPHHLMIRAFPSLFVLRHVLLLIMFATVWSKVRRDPRAERLWGVVWAAILAAFVGAAIDAFWGHTQLGLAVLRYYWFRATDVMVPLGVLFATWLWLDGLERRRARWAVAGWSGLALGALAWLLVTAGQFRREPLAAADRQGNMMTVSAWRDWRDVCAWVERNLPQDACVLTPPDQQTFKWYAERGEVVTWKDVPQDAVSLVAWRQRLGKVRAWQNSETAELAAAHWQELRTSYPFQYLLVREGAQTHLPNLPALFQNGSYRVLVVKDLLPNDPLPDPLPDREVTK